MQRTDRIEQTQFLAQKVKLLTLAVEVTKAEKESPTREEVLDTYRYLFHGVRSHVDKTLVKKIKNRTAIIMLYEDNYRPKITEIL